MGITVTSRREFMRSAAGTALAGGAGLSLLSTFGCSRPNAVPPISGLPWGELERSLTGSLIRPGQSRYHSLASPNNLRYKSLLPAGIALCAGANDVSASILWAENTACRSSHGRAAIHTPGTPRRPDCDRPDDDAQLQLRPPNRDRDALELTRFRGHFRSYSEAMLWKKTRPKRSRHHLQRTSTRDRGPRVVGVVGLDASARIR